jgi:hypothetical protein
VYARDGAQVHRKYAEYAEKPEDDHNHDDDVEDVLNLAIHGNILIGQPEQEADHDENDDNGDYWHSKDKATRPSDGCLS